MGKNHASQYANFGSLLVGARFARPKTTCLVYYSQGSDRWFGQANPAPTVNNLTDHFTFGTPLIFYHIYLKSFSSSSS